MYIGRLARASGIKARGHTLVTGPDGTVESETFTCNHCNCGTAMPRNAGEDIAGKLCLCCNQMICARCAKQGTCKPFEQRLDEIEAEMQSKQSLFQAAGIK